MKATNRLRRAGLMAGSSLLLAGAVSSCGQSSQPAPTPQPPLAGEAAVRTAMNDLIADGGPPGVIAVVQDGAQRYEIGEGKADLSSGQAMTAGAPMRIASVSKAFNGSIILSMVSNGQLKLTSTVGELLPTAPASWGKATVAQMLQHTSGLPDYIKSPKFLKEFIANPKMERTPAQLIGYVANKPPEFTPGSQYNYSDTDNIVTGLIAERLTGKSYQDVLAGEVSTRLGLTATTLPTDATMPAGFIHGYALGEPASGSASPTAPTDVSEEINAALAWASGGMVTTPFELNTFFRAYTAGQLFSPAEVAAQRQFVPGAGGPPGPGINSSGLGIYRYQTKCGTFLGHTGNMPGYTAFVASTPDGTRSVVVGVNSQITPKSNSALFQKLLAVENQALCAVNPGGSASPSPSASGSASPSQ